MKKMMGSKLVAKIRERKVLGKIYGEIKGEEEQIKKL